MQKKTGLCFLVKRILPLFCPSSEPPFLPFLVLLLMNFCGALCSPSRPTSYVCFISPVPEDYRGSSEKPQGSDLKIFDTENIFLQICRTLDKYAIIINFYSLFAGLQVDTTPLHCARHFLSICYIPTLSERAKGYIVLLLEGVVSK